MGIIESGVNSAVRFTFRNGRWVVPITLTGCMIGAAFLNALPRNPFDTSPRPTPSPIPLAGFGGGGEPLQPTAIPRPTNGSEICVEVGGLPPGRQTAWSAAEKLAQSTGRSVDSLDTITIRRGKGDWGTTTFKKIRQSEYMLVFLADKLCAEGKR